MPVSEKLIEALILVTTILVAAGLFRLIFRYLSDIFDQYPEIQWTEIMVPPTPPDTPLPRPSERRRQLAAHDEIVVDTYKIQENSKEIVGGGGCAICLEEYKYGETRATITACNHKYHAVCIKAWLLENDTCPLCRTHVV